MWDCCSILTCEQSVQERAECCFMSPLNLHELSSPTTGQILKKILVTHHLNIFS